MVILGLWFVFAQTLIWKPVSTFFSCDVRSCASLFSTSCESDNTGSPQAFFLCVLVPVLAFLWGPAESGLCFLCFRDKRKHFHLQTLTLTLWISMKEQEESSCLNLDAFELNMVECCRSFVPYCKSEGRRSSCSDWQSWGFSTLGGGGSFPGIVSEEPNGGRHESHYGGGRSWPLTSQYQLDIWHH